MILSLNEVKTWLRVDGKEEDTIITTLMEAAETYLNNATGVKFDSSNQLAKLYCLVLCADWYENRDLIGQQPSDKVRFTCRAIMTQLQNAYSGDVNG